MEGVRPIEPSRIANFGLMKLEIAGKVLLRIKRILLLL